MARSAIEPESASIIVSATCGYLRGCLQSLHAILIWGLSLVASQKAPGVADAVIKAAFLIRKTELERTMLWKHIKNRR